MSVENTLNTRAAVHGNYVDAASFKDSVLQECVNCKTGNWEKLGPVGRQTVHMIIEKLGRIMYGDPLFSDHWHDIAGYATLMDNYLVRPVQTEIPLNYEEGV